MLKSVADSYIGKSVFVTGCTGFLGKALLEKLLYSCHGLEKIYVLVRENEKASAQLRVQKIIEQPAFYRIRNEKFEKFKKIVPISGDISKFNLGISDRDEEVLIDNVSIVFHAAATVKFNEPLAVAIDVNVTGTERMLKLSQRMKNIKSFVYVSTAFANTDKPVLEEVVYPPPVPLEEIKNMLDVGVTEQQLTKLLDSTKRANTYTFTKALAESTVAKNHGSIPTAIIRPSAVSGSKMEPYEGWIDSCFGVTEFIRSIGFGLNRVILASPTNLLDFIPVDYVTNLMIVAASKCESSKVTVYNCTTSGENPITSKQFMSRIIEDNLKYKSYNLPWKCLIFSQSKTVVKFLTSLLQNIPAYTADAYLMTVKKNTRYIKMQDKAQKVRSSMEYFTTNTWIFRAKKSRDLSQSLSPSNRQKFPFDPTDIKWSEYLPIYCKGIRNISNNKHL